jgi:hypothetical protein
MKIILLFFCSIILPILSFTELKQIKPKLCINCKYFISDNDSGRFSKCSLFPLEINNYNFLVNGIEETEYYYCSTARNFDNMCGIEGNMHKRKYIKKRKGGIQIIY